MAGEAEVWFRANALSQAERQFYLYYGNPDTTWTASETAAWNANYRAVYHFVVQE